MKKFLLFTFVLMPLCFVACSDETVIEPKQKSVVDFLELYQKDAEYMRHALKKYIINEDGVNDDGDNYWTIQQKNNKISPKILYGGDEVFVSFVMKNNICVSVSLFCSDSPYAFSWSIQHIQDKYGEGNDLSAYNSNYGRDWYKWLLDDGSEISYYAFESSSIIYREKAEMEDFSIKKLEQITKIAN